MYVVPFLMGPPGSPYSKVGVEITDSRYVVLNMRIMTRIGQPALDHLGDSQDFTRCLHSVGDLSPDRRFIMHFPEENAVWSIGSGYGGNALLGKKCLALRLASIARQRGLASETCIVGCNTRMERCATSPAPFLRRAQDQHGQLVPPHDARRTTWTVAMTEWFVRVGRSGGQ